MKAKEHKISFEDTRSGKTIKKWFCSQCLNWHNEDEEHPKKIIKRKDVTNKTIK